MVEQQRRFARLTHFRGMPSQLRRQMIRSYDDLFVVSDHLSAGLARLIKAVQAKAEAQAWSFVRWITHDHNYWAHGLNDKLLEKTDRVLCVMTDCAAK